MKRQTFVDRVPRGVLILGTLAAILLIVAGIALTTTGGKKQTTEAPAVTEADFPTPVPSPEPAPAPPTAPPTVFQDPNLNQLGTEDRMLITKIGVNAPLVLKTVGLNGVMPDPDNPDDIAYYNFSSFPGYGGGPGHGGNSVFAGHVDSGFKSCKNGTVKPPCAAVLYSLKTLKAGDEIELRVSGQSYIYQVATNEAVSPKDGPWEKIVASTPQETLTIITCGGVFRAGEYDHRQVVTAVRV